MAARVELLETKDEDFRSLAFGEVEVVPPIVDLRTTAKRHDMREEMDAMMKVSK